ncbi:MAG: transcriptional regulator [Myxococcales bacterium]|nr:transcriptional regulator [Myxococcales bacterium]MCB9642262.1 transcriptional regulator [Myxococcales bacterium]
MSKPLAPKPPPQRSQTPRQVLIDLLGHQSYDVRQLSKEAHLSERDVLFQLEELQRSLKKSPQRLEIEPARCLSCGYTFETRERFQRPGRCPKCKGQRISHPLFSLRGPSQE